MDRTKVQKTLGYYEKYAQEFVSDTVDASLKFMLDDFISRLNNDAHILDLGCGSGRDSLYFIKAGFKVTAVDGSIELCKLASDYISQDVICHTFESYIPDSKFDGIWACSSLLHLDSSELPRMLLKYIGYLNSGGTFYLSFKYGDDEGFIGERYYNNMTEDKFRNVIKGIDSIKIIDENITDDVRVNHKNEKWYNVLLKMR
jgi:SAM-dependent methyltransferase